MSALSKISKLANIATTALVALPLVAGASAHADTSMTAGVVLEKMKASELYFYVYGIVDGMAYARFRKDTLAAGTKQQDGMNCIYDWYTANDFAAFARIEGAFRANANHFPTVIIAALIKKECGE